MCGVSIRKQGSKIFLKLHDCFFPIHAFVVAITIMWNETNSHLPSTPYQMGIFFPAFAGTAKLGSLADLGWPNALTREWMLYIQAAFGVFYSAEYKDYWYCEHLIFIDNYEFFWGEITILMSVKSIVIIQKRLA